MKNQLLQITKRSIAALLIFLAVSVPLHALAQTINVSGKVTMVNSDEGIPGVSVVEKGSVNGTVTDINGQYTFEVSATGTIQFSFVGFKTQEIPVNGLSSVNVVMEEDFQQLDQVVVTGYQSQRKADLTGAVSVIDVDEIVSTPSANPIKSLQGHVPGMFVTSDGSPSGSGTTIRIRGIGTLNNNDPLYVIDGVPTKAGMHELNPNDIESIQVLKDASSASIYGSRAANGVIIVTTKKGKKGKIQVNLNAYSNISWYDNKIDVMNAEQYGSALWRSLVNTGTDPNSNNLSYQFDWNGDLANPSLNKILVPKFLDANQTMKASDTDWFDEVSQTSVSQSYDLSVSNGTDKGSYLFSLGYLDNQGIIKTTEFTRVSARMNSNYELADGKVVIGENFSFNQTNEVNIPGGVMDGAVRAVPLIPVHTVDGIGWGGPVGGMNDRQNPVRVLQNNKQNDYDYIRLFGNFFVDVEPVKSLKFRSSLGIDYGIYDALNSQLSYSSGYLKNETNMVTNNHSSNKKIVWSNTLSYEYEVDNHRFDIMAGSEFYKQKDESFWASAQDFAVEDEDYMYLDAATGKKDNGGSAAEYALMSYFGKMNYVYNDKYLASATLRYDGSSRFGNNNQYGLFPAFSVGWRINQEDFIKDNLKSVSNLKLRFGWGKTGNQEIDNNATYSLYQTNYGGGDPTWRSPNGTAYDMYGQGTGTLPSGYSVVQTGNDDLKWETTIQTNLGIDFGLFDQKLFGGVDYFFKSTKDILILPGYIGAIGEGGSRWVNGASMENEGLEVLVGYRGSLKEEFKFEIAANFATYSNKITKLPLAVVNDYGGNGSDDNILNRPINSMYGYVADGLFRTQEELDASAEQPGKGLGRIRFADLDNNGVVDDADRTWIGNPHPDFTYGLNISAEFKGFDLTMFFQGIAGIDVINDMKRQGDFWSVDDAGSNKGTRLLNAWTPENSNSSIPALTNTDANWEGRFSTYYVENGGYMKLRTAQLGYSFPKSVIDRLKLSKLRLYVSGQNLWTIKSKKFTGLDPENPSFGYPNPVMITTGVNVAF